MVVQLLALLGERCRGRGPLTSSPLRGFPLAVQGLGWLRWGARLLCHSLGGAALSSPPQAHSEGCSLHLEGEWRTAERDGRAKQEARDWALQSHTASWEEGGRSREEPGGTAHPGTGWPGKESGLSCAQGPVPRGCSPSLDQFLKIISPIRAVMNAYKQPSRR